MSGNIGTTKISDTMLLMCDSEFPNRLKEFLTQGSMLIGERLVVGGSELTKYTLNHPDFTEPDGTEYSITVTRTPNQQVWICALQAHLPNENKTVKTYENPYV
jgi:hypothetical protein